MLVLKTLYENLKGCKPLIWINDQPTQEDLDHIIREGESPSEYDPLKLRKEMLDDLRAGKATLLTRSCKYAKVLAVVYPSTKIPWELFGKIFQAFGPAKGEDWRLLWFANPIKRLLPENTIPSSAHMNGGYAIPCHPSTVVVYREEEVARVLIHELLHAACTDDPNDQDAIREAKTETWAELFLVALQSKSLQDLKRLWGIQEQWIVDQEEFLKTIGPNDYAWRYTVGRRHVLEDLGMPLTKQGKSSNNSMRFTTPALDKN